MLRGSRQLVTRKSGMSPACYEEVTRKLTTFRPSRHVQMVWRVANFLVTSRYLVTRKLATSPTSPRGSYGEIGPSGIWASGCKATGRGSIASLVCAVELTLVIIAPTYRKTAGMRWRGQLHTHDLSTDCVQWQKISISRELWAVARRVKSS